MLPLLLIGAGVILVLAVLVWQGVTNSPANTVNTNQTGDIPFPEVERVSVNDTRAAFDQDAALIVDVRDENSYTAGHIPGSINIPFDQIQDRVGELDPAQRIITYCT